MPHQRVRRRNPLAPLQARRRLKVRWLDTMRWSASQTCTRQIARSVRHRGHNRAGRVQWLQVQADDSLDWVLDRGQCATCPVAPVGSGVDLLGSPASRRWQTVQGHTRCRIEHLVPTLWPHPWSSVPFGPGEGPGPSVLGPGRSWPRLGPSVLGSFGPGKGPRPRSIFSPCSKGGDLNYA